MNKSSTALKEKPPGEIVIELLNSDLVEKKNLETIQLIN